MKKWEDMSEKTNSYLDQGYKNARTSLMLAVFSISLAITGFWITEEYWNIFTTAVALTAFIPGILGFRDRENPYILSSAIALATCSIMLQYWVFAVAIILLVLIVIIIFSILGVPL